MTLSWNSMLLLQTTDALSSPWSVARRTTLLLIVAYSRPYTLHLTQYKLQLHLIPESIKLHLLIKSCIPQQIQCCTKRFKFHSSIHCFRPRPRLFCDFYCQLQCPQTIQLYFSYRQCLLNLPCPRLNCQKRRPD